MASQYKFECRSCKLQCVSGIGVETGLHHITVAMVCRSCIKFDNFILAKPGSINPEISIKPICKTCNSSHSLERWDGLTCPHCKSHMRAIGNPVGAKRPRRDW